VVLFSRWAVPRSTLKNKKEDHIMRLLILAAAATFVTGGTAMAAQHHYRAANASVAEVSAAPADTLSAHDAYIKNLHDSGYNPAGDHDSAGNIRQN
jgi:hypothetical protein